MPEKEPGDTSSPSAEEAKRRAQNVVDNATPAKKPHVAANAPDAAAAAAAVSAYVPVGYVLVVGACKVAKEEAVKLPLHD